MCMKTQTKTPTLRGSTPTRYIYIYTHIYKYIYICIPTPICTYVNIYLYICLNINVYICIHIYVHVCAYEQSKAPTVRGSTPTLTPKKLKPRRFSVVVLDPPTFAKGAFVVDIVRYVLQHPATYCNTLFNAATHNFRERNLCGGYCAVCVCMCVCVCVYVCTCVCVCV